MGNKSSTELWADTYKVYEKELLSFDDEAAEKVQMGELDMMDEKAMAAFVRQYRETINKDRASLVEAIFAQYGKNKERIGLSEVRAITKDAIKHGETHLSALLVKFNETAAMKAPGTGKGASILLMDLASKPFIEASLTRIRKDIAERIKNQLHELLSESNRLGEVVLYRVKKLAEKGEAETKGEGEAETKAEGQVEEQKKDNAKEDESVPAKIDPKLTVSKSEFVPHFHAALCQALGMDQLIASTRAQFISFLDIEVRNIPERVAKSQGPTTIEAVDDSEDEGEKNPRGRSTAVSPVESNKSGDEDDDEDEEEEENKEEKECEKEECDKKGKKCPKKAEAETVTSTESEQDQATPSESQAVQTETVSESTSNHDSTPSDSSSSSSSDACDSSSASTDDS